MSATQEVGDIFQDVRNPAHAMLRSPTVLIAAIGLWGMNVYFFRLFGIDFVKVFQHDLRKIANEEDAEAGNLLKKSSRPTREQNPSSFRREPSDTTPAADSSEKAELMDDDELAIMDPSVEEPLPEEVTAFQYVCLSMTLLFLLHTSYIFWIDWLQGGAIGAIFAFYLTVGVAIIVPIQATRWLRLAASIVLHRAWELINPRCHCILLDSKQIPRPIPFVDVFFADAMCSLSKVFFDWGMLLHMASYYPNPVRKSVWNIIVPSSFAAVPYLIRARQCFVMWSVTQLKNDPGRYQHLWNALKYSTSIFPLLLSAYQKTTMAERADELEIYLIVLLAINASYSLWWDVGKWKTRCLRCSCLTNVAEQ